MGVPGRGGVTVVYSASDDHVGLRWRWDGCGRGVCVWRLAVVHSASDEHVRVRGGRRNGGGGLRLFFQQVMSIFIMCLCVCVCATVVWRRHHYRERTACVCGQLRHWPCGPELRQTGLRCARASPGPVDQCLTPVAASQFRKIHRTRTVLHNTLFSRKITLRLCLEKGILAEILNTVCPFVLKTFFNF